jgi:hypothetical protein
MKINIKKNKEIKCRLYSSASLASSCKYINEYLGSIKTRKILDYLSDYYLLQNTSVPCSKLLT